MTSSRHLLPGRVSEKIEFGDCWSWTASRDRTGYGKVAYEGRLWPAHRLVYTLLVGPIPADTVLTQTCGSRTCVRPEHQDLGARKEGIGIYRGCHATPAKDRFLVKVKKTDACWIWGGSRNKDDYGCFEEDLAHRWAYREFVGEIPAGLYVLHHCDNPPCVNPAHLFVGTQFDNMADCAAKGRRRPPHKPRIELSAETRKEIRRRCLAGAKRRQVADEFGVTPAVVKRIVERAS